MTGPVEAAELLAYRLCDPRCLLAMESAPGDTTACTCACGGRYHAALVFAEVLPQPWMCPSCQQAPEDCCRVRAVAGGGPCCDDCGHTPPVLDTARRFLAGTTISPDADAPAPT